MMDKLKQNLEILKKAYKLKKFVKNDLLNLYLYAILKPPYVKLELRNRNSIVLSSLNYEEILDGCYLGRIIDISEKRIKVELDGKEHYIPVDELSYSTIAQLLIDISEGWEYLGYCWERNGAKFKHIYYSIKRIFEEKQWDFLNVEDKNVLDIGAFVGDSSIYFILKGAKKVYAIEPHPFIYSEIIENIELNDMEDKIIPINMGISYKKNYIVINTIKTSEAEHTLFRSEGNGFKVPAGKLSKIIDRFNIDAQVLKIDCAGCEYDIILKDYSTIKEFDEIGFEYHAFNTGISINKLLEKLSKDFTCRIIWNWSDSDYPEGKRGILHCIRRK